MDLDALEPVLKRWVKKLCNERVKYRLYAWDNDPKGLWVHLKANSLAGGYEYDHFQILNLKYVNQLQKKYERSKQ